MKADDIQLRGICQCCGRQQAVIAGRMSKHGYTVETGWFKGVCRGQNFEPMQISRAEADNTIRQVRADCKMLRQRAEDLTAGRIKPAEAKSGNKIKVEGKAQWAWPYEMVAFADAPKHYQTEAISGAAWQATSRADLGESFCNSLEKLANEYHGKPLVEVKRDAGPEPIAYGEQRTSTSGLVLTVTEILRGRVWWKSTRADGKTYNGWTGTQAFRKFPKVEKISP